MRLGFVIVAAAVLAGVAWFSFQTDDAATRLKPVAASEPAAAVERAPTTGPASRVNENELPRQIPYNQLTTVAKTENRVIYTTSSLGEPMEVHPDGLVVIYNHRQVIRYGDGREETRFVTLRARPKLAPPPVLLEDEEKALQGGTDPK